MQFWFVVWVCSFCGQAEGPQRYHVSGTVTHGGKPVPSGSVLFVPDTKQGNHGPAGTAAIENGRFDTRTSGKSPLSGPHVVKIVGLDGKASDMLPHGESIFPEYETTVDLPLEDSTLDFEVPRR